MLLTLHDRNAPNCLVQAVNSANINTIKANTKMKQLSMQSLCLAKNFLALTLCGVMMMPATLMALPDNDKNDYYPGQHRSPAYSPYVYIIYNESTGIATVCFKTDVADAEFIIYQNGMEVDYQVIDATAGMQVPITLSAYGSGEFVIQVKSGSTLLATFNVTL